MAGSVTATEIMCRNFGIVYWLPLANRWEKTRFLNCDMCLNHRKLFLQIIYLKKNEERIKFWVNRSIWNDSNENDLIDLLRYSLRV